ncbi:hypothetical protein TWF696_001908 [Orbilia brochopaga]|uniref:Uncharacterized protein n=1 Tax=Orbilia brochopaga TaxID=3140254 RepID=A0AAV9UAM9_9PEZI
MKPHTDRTRVLSVLRALCIANIIFSTAHFCVAVPLSDDFTTTTSTALVRRDDPPKVPPGSDAKDSSAFRSFYEPTCTLGMWSDSFRDGYGKELWSFDTKLWKWWIRNMGQWEGFPFGDGFPPNTCVKTKDLNDRLDNSITQYRLAGYCECEFFDNDNCEGHLFNAFNRDDMQLRTNGPDNDRISSFKCWPTDHYDSFVNGHVELFYQDSLGTAVQIEKKDFQQIDQFGFGTIWRTTCYNLPEGNTLRKYVVTGVTCQFYDNIGCWGAGRPIDYVTRTGHAGVDSLGGLGDPPYALKSFFCMLPFGIAFEPRKDM